MQLERQYSRVARLSSLFVGKLDHRKTIDLLDDPVSPGGHNVIIPILPSYGSRKLAAIVQSRKPTTGTTARLCMKPWGL
jgi:hypothetical protein